MMLPLSLGSLEAENQLLFAITVALLVIASVSISLRSLVRKLILKQFGWDDWAILAAHALYIATCALTLALISTQESIELTQEGPTAANIKLLVRFHNACYVATMITAKVSLGVFFYSLFTGTTHQYQRYLVVASIAVPSIVGVIYLGMTLFSCTASVSLLFVDNCDIQGTYTDLSIIWTALNSGSDLILSTLAVMALLRSKLPPFAKFSAAALLVLGTTGGLASILRLVSQIMAQSDPLQGIVLARWSNTEAGLCIIAASLVTLRPLFGQAVSKRLSRLSGWNWASKEGGTGFSTTSVSSAGPSRANSFFSRNKSVSRSKSRNKSFSATVTNRSIRSVRSQRSGRSRRPSCDPFVEYIDSNAGQSVATAAQESDAVRMPSTIADPGGLLAMEEVKFGEGGGWGKFGDVVVTLEVDVSAEEKKRTKSVCFGPDVEKGAGSSNGARLLMPQRPAFVRTRSAR